MPTITTIVNNTIMVLVVLFCAFYAGKILMEELKKKPKTAETQEVKQDETGR